MTGLPSPSAGAVLLLSESGQLFSALIFPKLFFLSLRIRAVPSRSPVSSLVLALGPVLLLTTFTTSACFHQGLCAEWVFLGQSEEDEEKDSPLLLRPLPESSMLPDSPLPGGL